MTLEEFIEQKTAELQNSGKYSEVRFKLATEMAFGSYHVGDRHITSEAGTGGEIDPSAALEPFEWKDGRRLGVRIHFSLRRYRARRFIDGHFDALYAR